MIGTLLMFTALLQTSYAWTCIPLQSKQIYEGITWNTQNCSVDDTKPPLLTVNSIHITLDNPKYRVVPAVADAVQQVQSIPAMAAQNPNLIAGINGGYFWRVDMDGFWRDNVCHGKTRQEAERPGDALYTVVFVDYALWLI